MPGETLHAMGEAIGRELLSSNERQVNLEKYRKASHLLGKAVGEYQSKGLKFQKKPSAEKISAFIDEGLEALKTANLLLKEANVPTIKILSHFEEISKKFRDNPGEIFMVFTILILNRLFIRKRNRV